MGVRRYTAIPEYSSPTNKELSLPIDRTLGIAMILRLLSYDIESNKMSNEEVENVLSNYTDVSEVPEWSKKILAFSLKNKFVSGVSENRIGVKESFTGKMFTAIALKAIGYSLNSEDYECACAVLSEKGGLTVRQAVLLNEKKLIKDDIIGMLYGLLKAERVDKKTVIEKVIEDDIANKGKAKEYGLIK